MFVVSAGVVRKRFMPLKFTEALDEFEPGSDFPVFSEKPAKVST